MEVPDNVAFFKNMDKSLHNLSASLPCLGCRICSLVHKFVGYGQDDFYTDAFFFYLGAPYINYTKAALHSTSFNSQTLWKSIRVAHVQLCVILLLWNYHLQVHNVQSSIFKMADH